MEMEEGETGQGGSESERRAVGSQGLDQQLRKVQNSGRPIRRKVTLGSLLIQRSIRPIPTSHASTGYLNACHLYVELCIFFCLTRITYQYFPHRLCRCPRCTAFYLSIMPRAHLRFIVIERLSSAIIIHTSLIGIASSVKGAHLFFLYRINRQGLRTQCEYLRFIFSESRRDFK